MIYRNFKDDLKTGELAEQLILSKFRTVFEPIISRIIYNQDMQSRLLQKAGVDGIITARPIADFDIKARDFKYYNYKNQGVDILFETISIVEKSVPGWFYKSNVVVYVWFTQNKSRFADGYILYMDKLREKLKDVINNYPKKTAHSENGSVWSVWSTENRAVPIKDIPISAIQRIHKSTFQDYAQLGLGQWFE